MTKNVSLISKIIRKLKYRKELSRTLSVLSVFTIFCVLNLNTFSTKFSNKIRILGLQDFEWNRPWFCKESPKYTQFNKSFIFCGYNPQEDHYISIWFDLYIPYDKRMMEHFISAAHLYPDSYVIDLGSNSGPYSLLSVSLGHKTISVDPIITNQAFLFNSLVLSQNSSIPDSIQVLNAVSDSYTSMKAEQEQKTNPGATVMKQYDQKEPGENLSEVIESVLFEDILDLVPEGRPVALKIDVEGYECKALGNFLESVEKKRFIPYIMMEMVNICKDRKLCPDYQKFLSSLENSGYRPYLPWPVSWQELRTYTDEDPDPMKQCFMYALFIHKDGKHLTLLDQFKVTKVFYSSDDDFVIL